MSLRSTDKVDCVLSFLRASSDKILVEARFATSLWRRWRKPLQGLGIILIILLGAQVVYQNWQEISSYQWDIHYCSLLVSVLLFFASTLLGAVGWNRILGVLGQKLELRATTRIWLLSLVTKYLPVGTIWYVAGRIALCESRRISKLLVLLSVIIEVILLLVSSLIMFLASLPFWRGINAIRDVLPTLVIIPLGLLILSPPILGRVINLILSALGRGKLELKLRFRDILPLLAIYLVVWLSLGLAFYCLSNSVYDLLPTQLIVLTGIFAVSWAIGFMAVFVPNGLGVREGVLTYLLSFYMPLPVALAISMLARACYVFGEILAVVIYNGLDRLDMRLAKEGSV